MTLLAFVDELLPHQKALRAELRGKRREIEKIEVKLRDIVNAIDRAKYEILSKPTLRQRKGIKEELVARHMWEDWWDTDSPKTEISASVSFPDYSRMLSVLKLKRKGP